MKLNVLTDYETDPDKAYESYVCFGDDPWIDGVEFSASEYAKIKIQELHISEHDRATY